MDASARPYQPLLLASQPVFLVRVRNSGLKCMPPNELFRHILDLHK